MRIITKLFKVFFYGFLILSAFLIVQHHLTSDYYIKTQTGMTVETKNKIYPELLEKPILKALSYYPELDAVPIDFKIKKGIKKSTMQAQPKIWSLLKGRDNRSYVILIKQDFELNSETLPIHKLPNNVLVGWFGHELGHIMDYETMSNRKLISFGYKYLFSEQNIKDAERRADNFAIVHGMRKYIVATKNYILNNADVPDKYRNRIKNLYLSPEELMYEIESSN